MTRSGIALIGLSSGIVWGTYIDGSYVSVVLLALGSVSVLATALLGRLSVGSYALFCCFAVLGSAVLIHAMYVYDGMKQDVVFADGHQVRAVGVVVDDIELRETADVVYVSVSSITNLDIEIPVRDAHIRVFLPRHSAVMYGDTVTLSGTFSLPKPYMTDDGMRVPYDEIARAQGIVGDVFQGVVVSRAPQARANVFTYLYMIKRTFRSALESVIHEPYAGFAEGILIGEKHALPKGETDAFTRAGLSHITVLSGYNVGLVIWFFVWCFSFLYMRTRYIAAGGAAVVFVAMTGFGVPAVRSLLMALIVVSGKVFYERVDMLQALVVVCIGMVIWNPFILLNDISFQLSALATAGVICFQPYFARVFERYVPRGLVEYVSGTSAALVAVAPIIAYSFQTVSLIAPVANAVILPFIPFAMGISFAAAVVAMISTTIALPLGVAAQGLLAMLLFLVHVFAHVPYASVSVGMSLMVCGVIYAFLFRWAYFVYTGAGDEHVHTRDHRKRPEWWFR